MINVLFTVLWAAILAAGLLAILGAIAATRMLGEQKRWAQRANFVKNDFERIKAQQLIADMERRARQ